MYYKQYFIIFAISFQLHLDMHHLFSLIQSTVGDFIFLLLNILGMIDIAGEILHLCLRLDLSKDDWTMACVYEAWAVL